MVTPFFSGSFDPIHIGHAALASTLSQLDGIDELWLSLSPQNPLKSSCTPLFSDEQRLDMVSLTFADCRKIRVVDFEFSLPRPNYTFRTLSMLSERFPERKFTLVVGADNLLCFDRWRDPEAILQRFGLIVYPRPGFNLSIEDIEHYERRFNAPGSIRYVADVPLFDISSTYLRREIKNGKDIRYLVPDRAYEYIRGVGYGS